MAEKGPPAPTPKRGRPKLLVQTKAKAAPKPKVVPGPEDQQEGQNILYPPNQLAQLPDQPPNLPNPPNLPPLPPIQAHLQNPPNSPNQPPNPPNPANPPPNPPANPANPPNPPTPPPNPHDPMNVPNPPKPQQLNWSYFKPEFSGKAEEDAMGHLLKTNDWMETHNFPDDTKVRRFCLTLIGEARLWYESLRPIEMDWDALQECFRQ